MFFFGVFFVVFLFWGEFCGQFERHLRFFPRLIFAILLLGLWTLDVASGRVEFPVCSKVPPLVKDHQLVFDFFG